MTTIEEVESRAIQIIGESENLLEKALDIIEKQKARIIELEGEVNKPINDEDLFNTLMCRHETLSYIFKRKLIDEAKALHTLRSIDTALDEIRKIGWGGHPPEYAIEVERKLAKERFSIAFSMRCSRDGCAV